MGFLTAMFVFAAALSADLVIEVSAEISANTLLDADAGVAASAIPGKPTQIVDMAPRASIHWAK
ncbi:MAG: hypothetical protein O2995_15500 [Proteobacteria bacterium]|nr:hypothetical protein [Pseudomonadota bacterium]